MYLIYLFLIILQVTSINLFAKDTHMSSDKAIQTLVEGNQRYVEDRLEHPDRTSERREALAHIQKPFAFIVGCSDSRVAPEILFDQGVGDLFVVRVAENVVGKLELESIDFATKYLGSSVVLVLGHENCGAVSSVVENNTKDIRAIAKLIKPAVKRAKDERGNILENSIKMNVKQVVEQLKQTKILASLVKEGKFKIIGGYYNLKTGKVDILF